MVKPSVSKCLTYRAGCKLTVDKEIKMFFNRTNKEIITPKQYKYIPSNKVITAGMLGKAVGDALGVPVEFKHRDEMKSSPVTDMQGYGTYKNKPAGTWSDDTSMAIAAMASMVDEGGISYKGIMTYFSLWQQKGYFTTDGDCFDFGNTVYKAIANFRAKKSPLECGPSEDSDCGNGSLMRIFPFAMYYAGGLLEQDMEAMQGIANASSLTHGNYFCQEVCIVYSSILAYFAQLSDKNRLGEEDKILHLEKAIQCGIQNAESFSGKLDNRLDFLRNLSAVKQLDENSIEQLPSGGYVLDSIKASIWCFINTDSYRDCVLKAVNLGKDTDTTAAIVGALAGVYYTESAIPTEWIRVIGRSESIKLTCEKFSEMLSGNTQKKKESMLKLWSESGGLG